MAHPRRNTYEGGFGDSFIRNAYLLSYSIGRYPIIAKKDKKVLIVWIGGIHLPGRGKLLGGIGLLG